MTRHHRRRYDDFPAWLVGLALGLFAVLCVLAVLNAYGCLTGICAF